MIDKRCELKFPLPHPSTVQISKHADKERLLGDGWRLLGEIDDATGSGNTMLVWTSEPEPAAPDTTNTEKVIDVH